MDGALAQGFTLPVRVYWEDTDAGAIVYHGSYIRFLERARSDWLRSRGIIQSVIREQLGGLFVVSALSIRYAVPARLDDELLVTVQAEHFGRASVLLQQKVLRQQADNSQLLCQAQVKVGWIDAQTLRPNRIPETIFQKLI